MTPDNKIHIALATDDNYVDFVFVVLTSILHFHPQNGLPVSVHVLTTGLSSGQLARFEHFRKSGLEVTELPVDTVSFAKRWCGSNKPTFFRLELAERLPHVDRLIYLDCDMVVLDDIEKLWYEDLEGRPVGGVGDRAGLQPARNAYVPDGNMFNAGMLVLDLAMWRRENYVEKLASFWHDNLSWMHFADQGLLNAFFGKNYTMLHQRWNILNSVYRNPVVPGMYTDEEVTDAIRNPGIVHFTGHHKPWSFWKSFHHPYGYTFCLSALHSPIGFWKKAKLWLKLHLNNRFVDSPKERPWGRKDIKKIHW